MIQTKPIFKIGDKVYYPPSGNKIFTIERNGLGTYSLMIRVKKDERISFTEEGKEYSYAELPSIFPATKANCKKLSEFYGIQFEEPPSFLDTHLEKGSKVLCLIINENFEGDPPKFIWELNPSKYFIDVVSAKQESAYVTERKTPVYYRKSYPIAVDNKGHITYLD